MNQANKTTRVEDGVEIIEFRDESGRLHNPDGPAMEKGNAKIFAVHGNILGESMFNAWKVASLAAGIELPVTDPGIAEEANKKLNKTASLILPDTGRPSVMPDILRYDRAIEPPVPFAFDPVSRFSDNIAKATSENGRVVLSHTWETFFHEDRSFEKTDRKLAIAEMVEFEMQSCAPWFSLNESRGDPRKISAHIENSLDTTPAKKIDVSFSFPAFLHLPDKEPEKELRDLTELFRIMESSYERAPGIPTQFWVQNNPRGGQFAFHELVQQDIRDKVTVLLEKSEPLREWMNNINKTLNQINPANAWLNFSIDSVMGSAFNQELRLTNKNNGGIIESSPSPN